MRFVVVVLVRRETGPPFVVVVVSGMLGVEEETGAPGAKGGVGTREMAATGGKETSMGVGVGVGMAVTVDVDSAEVEGTTAVRGAVEVEGASKGLGANEPNALGRATLLGLELMPIKRLESASRRAFEAASSGL